MLLCLEKWLESKDMAYRMLIGAEARLVEMYRNRSRQPSEPAGE